MAKKMKIPKLKTFYIFALALYLNVGCSVENELIEQNQNSSIIHKKLNLEDLKKEKLIATELNEYSKIMKNSKLSFKTSDSYIIDVSLSNYLETDDFVSYTFSMPTTKVPLRNFLLKRNKNKTHFDGYIIEYNLTNEELLALQNQNIIDVSNKISSTHVGSNFSAVTFGMKTLNQTSNTCYGFVGLCFVGDQDGHVAYGSECTISSYQFQAFECPESGGIGGYSPPPFSSEPITNPPNNENHGGGGIVIAPIKTNSGPIEPIFFFDPCQQLKDLTNPALQNAKPALEDLKILVNSPLNYENGYLFRKDASGTRTTEQITPDITSDHSIPIKTGNTSYAAAHTHTYQLYPMFSWQDLYVLFSLYQNSTMNKSEATFILVAKNCITCSTVSTYAIKIDNFIKFRAKINSDLNNSNTNSFEDEDKFKYANDVFDELTNPGMINSTNVLLEKAFLQYINGHGVSLYKANDDLTNWDKLELSNSPIAPILKTPCK